MANHLLIEIYPLKPITIDKIGGGIAAVYDTAYPHIFYIGHMPFVGAGVCPCCHTICP